MHVSWLFYKVEIIKHINFSLIFYDHMISDYEPNLENLRRKTLCEKSSKNNWNIGKWTSPAFKLIFVLVMRSTIFY